jgi:hypothetical protein
MSQRELHLRAHGVGAMNSIGKNQIERLSLQDGPSVIPEKVSAQIRRIF